MRDGTRQKIEALFEKYPEKRGALLPAIYLVQEEQGWVSPDQARELAELFGLAPVEVWEVLTFYNMFYTSPQGRHHVYVCTNLPCSLRGARGLLRQIESHLGIRAGQTTEDGRVTMFPDNVGLHRTVADSKARRTLGSARPRYLRSAWLACLTLSVQKKTAPRASPSRRATTAAVAHSHSTPNTSPP